VSAIRYARRVVGAYSRLVALVAVPACVVSCALVVSFGDYDTATKAGAGEHHAVKGTVDGLAGGATLTLLLNGTTSVDAGNGPFSFSTSVETGAGYVVILKADPTGHHCVVAGGAGTVGSDDVTSVAVHCVPAPAGIQVSLDQDPNEGRFVGDVTILRAPNEANVTSYNLYWASDPGTKLARVASVPKTSAAMLFRFEGAASTVPQGARGLLAVVAAGAEEMSTGAFAAVSDNHAVYTDISAGQVHNGGTVQAAVLDAANGKLLVVPETIPPFADRPRLLRCNLDGTGCTMTDISAGQVGSTGYFPSAAIDVVGRKLLVVAANAADSFRPGVFRCNLDGTGATYNDISAGQGMNSGTVPSTVVDAAGGKLLVVTNNGANGERPSLFRCNLDGTGCAHTDISVGQGPQSGRNPSALVDASRGKVLVVTRNDANASKPSLFRCNLDGTGCTHTDISAGAAGNAASNPSAVIDVANDTLLVALETVTSQKLGLVRCKLDDTVGSTCVRTDISAGQGDASGFSPSAVIDAAHKKLLVVTRNGASSDRPSLFRCNLDGTVCSHTDLSAGQGRGSGNSPVALVDAAGQRLLVVTTNDANDSRSGLFTLGLW
jgi:hypothetical protein